MLMFSIQLTLCVVEHTLLIIFPEHHVPYMRLFDALIGITYSLGRFGMVLLFVFRLKESFMDSAFEVGKFTIYSLVIIDIIAVAMWIGISINVGHLNLWIVNGGVILYAWMDMSVNIAILYLFVKRLNILNKHNSDSKLKTAFNNIVKKFTHLQSLAFLSTLLVSIIAPIIFYITQISWMGRALIGIDAVINSYVSYYSMGFTNKKYQKYCTRCQNICLTCLCCIKRE